MRSLGWGFHDGISVHIRGDTGNFVLFLSPPSEHTFRRHLSKTHKEFLPEPSYAGTLILDLSAFRMLGNTFLLFKLPGLWYFVMIA